MTVKNILFIIGNGFDLAHGLKTSYHDFLLWYINKIAIKMRDSHDHSHKDGLLIVSSHYKSTNRSYTLEEFKEDISSGFISIDYGNPLFEKVLNHYSDSKWIDIEYVYFQEILSHYLSHVNHWNKNIEKLSEINLCLDLIKEQLVDYLSTIPTILPKNSKIQENFQIERNTVPPENIRFLVFNYTRTVELYLKDLGITKDQVIYIHGSILDDQNPIIFGYGDEINPYYSKIEDLNENEYLRNIKSFSYLKTTNLLNLNRFIEADDYTVSIMGHSCGLSDRVLLNSIFCNKNCRSIRIYYHQKGPDDTDYFEKTMEISRHFRSEDKGEMRKLIVPFPHSRAMS